MALCLRVPACVVAWRQILQALAYMCLDNFPRAIAVANNVEVVSQRRFRVSTWGAVGAPLLKGLLPVSLLKAFANYIDTHSLGDSLGVKGTTLAPPPMKFGGATSTALAYLRHPSHPRPREWWKSQLKAAHPWGFWGTCPGGVKPPAMVVAAPSQFTVPSRSGRAAAVDDDTGSDLVCEKLQKVVSKSRRRAAALRAKEEASDAVRHRHVWDTATYLQDIQGEEEGDTDEEDISDLHESFTVPWYPRLTGTVTKNGC